MSKHNDQLTDPLSEQVAERMTAQGYVFDADDHEWIAPDEIDFNDNDDSE